MISVRIGAIICALLALCSTPSAQVGINTTGNQPEPSSGLDVDFNDRGLLPPRLTSAQRDAIVNPAAGLLIFNIETTCYNYYNGNAWMEWCGNCVPQPSSAQAGSDQLQIDGTSTTLTGNAPTSGTGTWSIVSGEGGSIAEPGNPASSFSGIAGNSYVLAWTISNSCNSSVDQVLISFASPAAGYANGNEAYWTEKNLGYNDVSIGGGSTIFSWDPTNKVYRNGNTILIPDLTAIPNGQTVNASTFFGFGLGGSINGTQFNFDKTPLPAPNRGPNYSAVYDRTNMFVSPFSSFQMSYCRAMQNSHGGVCTNSSGTYVINNPVVYPDGPSGSTFTIHQSDGKFDAGKVDNGTDNERIHQQSLEAGSYCNATYGKGWRIPTKMEFGMLIDGAQGYPEEIYQDGGPYKSMWTSNYWPLSLPYNKQVAYSNQYQFNTNNPDTPNYVRCVFAAD